MQRVKENKRVEFSQIAWQFVKFCLVSLPGVGLAFGFLNIFMFLLNNFPAANAVTFLIVVTWNFILHRRFTFGCTTGSAIHQWFKYVLAYLGAAVLNLTISMSFYYSFDYFNRHFNYAAITGAGFACIAHFLHSRSHVFRKD